MANHITVDIQDNPIRDAAGTTNADATIINSGYKSGIITYQIERMDNHGLVVTIDSNSEDISKMPQIVKIDSETLHMILSFRTHYRVRVRRNYGSWSVWTNFKTRDKRYQTPDAITQLTDNLYIEAGAHTIHVTNGAKSSVTETAAGATVINTDTGYNDTTSVTKTAKGATVVNTTKITYTSRGATVDNT